MQQMKIQSNATPSEKSSPFYKINEDFCREFEDFIASKSGKVSGRYNAWTYFIQAEILTPKSWHLKYKKATFSSTGNLILASKEQSLLTLVEWATPRAGSDGNEFRIRVKNSVGWAERFFNKKLTVFRYSKDFLIMGEKENPRLIENLYQKLKPLFTTREIFSIVLKNNTLTISLRTEKHHFNFFDKLLDL